MAKMSVSVTVDTCHHENELCEHLRDLGLAPERRQLKTGDVMLHHAGRTILIELKSVSNHTQDHLAGGRDGVGTFHAERSRLAGEQAAAPGVSSLLLLWGVRPRCNDEGRLGFSGAFTGVDFATSLQRTMFAYGISVWHAGNGIEDAAAWIALLAKNMQLDKLDTGTVVVDRNASPPDLTRKRARDSTPQELVGGMLSALPGMSKKKATAVVSVYPSLGDLCDVESKTLADVDCGGRRLGKALAERVKSLF